MSERAQADVRAEVLFGGQVQGVGFRYRTLLAAEPHRVSGYVRNLRNGKVELVAEGARSEVEALLAGVRERLHGYIVDELVHWASATGEFKGFAVRY